jgi:hypothetical protein
MLLGDFKFVARKPQNPFAFVHFGCSLPARFDGRRMPNVDRIVSKGALFMDYKMKSTSPEEVGSIANIFALRR